MPGTGQQEHWEKEKKIIEIEDTFYKQNSNYSPTRSMELAKPTWEEGRKVKSFPLGWRVKEGGREVCWASCAEEGGSHAGTEPGVDMCGYGHGQGKEAIHGIVVSRNIHSKREDNGWQPD